MLLIWRSQKKCRNKFSTLQKLVHELKRKGKYSFEVNKYQSKNKYDDIHFKKESLEHEPRKARHNLNWTIWWRSSSQGGQCRASYYWLRSTQVFPSMVPSYFHPTIIPVLSSQLPSLQRLWASSLTSYIKFSLFFLTTLLDLFLSKQWAQFMGSLGVGHDWTTSLSLFTFMHWRRKWQPTPVFLPGESQGRRAWWASVYGVAQSRIRLKRLSSSSKQWTGKTFWKFTFNNKRNKAK